MARKKKMPKRNKKGRFIKKGSHKARKSRKSRKRGKVTRRKARRHVSKRSRRSSHARKSVRRKRRQNPGTYVPEGMMATATAISKAQSKKKGKKKASKKKGKRKGFKKTKRVSKRRMTSTRKAIKRTSKALAKWKGKKGKRAKGKRAGYRAKLAALRVSKRRPGVSKKFSSKAKAFGLARTNGASLMQALNQAKQLVVPGLAIFGGLLGVAVLWTKYGNKLLPASVTSKVPASIAPYVPALGIGLLGTAAFVGMKMLSSKLPILDKLAPAVMLGSIAGAGVMAAAMMPVTKQVAGADGVAVPTTMSLARSLGLPIGEFVGVSGYVQLPSGHQVAVNGLGEFVGVSGMVRSASGGMVAVNGGMGDYLHEEVGMSGMGSIFNESTLGGMPEQEAMGRDADHGLSEEVTAEDIMGGGSLSGGIFDD